MPNLLIHRSTLGLVLVGALSGCSETSDREGNGSLQSAVIWFRTLDGATAQAAPIEADVQDQGLRVDDTLMQDLAARVSVRTWPEAAVVGADVEPVREANGVRLLRITPRAPLDDRWYRAGFDSLPAHVLVLSPGEENGVRFHPGSHPRVASIQFCGVGNGGVTQKMLVDFSEPMIMPPAGAVSLHAVGQSASCDQDSANETQLHFICSGLTPTVSVTVSVAAGVTGASGVTMAPASFDVNLAGFPASDCGRFIPPI